MNSNALSMTIELKDKFSKQIQEVKKNTETLTEAVEKLNVNNSKIALSETTHFPTFPLTTYPSKAKIYPHPFC